LPVVYPLIVYTGATPYNHSTDLYDLFGDNKVMAKNAFLRPYRLINYREIKNQDLEKFLYHGMVVKAMRHIHDADFLLSLQSVIMPHLKMIANLVEKDYIFDILHYVFCVNSIDDERAFIEIVQQGLTQEFGENVMTLAERLEQRGMQRGMRQGMQSTLEKVVISMLEQQLSIEQIAKITNLSLNKIEELKAKQQKH
jgi:hypothetical protein